MRKLCAIIYYFVVGGKKEVEPVTGLEPATHSLQNCCATIAPHRLRNGHYYATSLEHVTDEH